MIIHIEYPGAWCHNQHCAAGLLIGNSGGAGFGVMTTILIILACAFYKILHVSVWLFIVMYALVCFLPLMLISLSPCGYIAFVSHE